MGKKEIIVYSSIGSIIGGIILALIFFIASKAIPIAQGVSIMVGEFLHTPIEVFWLVLSILFFALILALIAKKVWITMPKQFNSKHNELLKKTKPPSSTDKLIKAEVEHSSTGKVGIEGNPPHLIFNIRVINRANYCFKPKKVFLKCNSCCPKDLIFKEEWGERAKSQHIYPTELQSGEDGSIQFHVPKENIDESKRKFTLGGYVEYLTEEGIIHEDLRKCVKLNIPKLEYELNENITSEPKGRVIILK